MHSRFSTAATAVAGSLVLAFGAVACSSNDGDEPPAANAGSTRALSDEEQIKQVLSDAQADYNAGDGTSYCTRLTAGGKREVAEFGRAYGHGTSCPTTMSALSRLSHEAGLQQKPAKIVSLRLRGDRATAMVSDGGRPAAPLRFVKQNGVWKIPHLGLSPKP